MCVLSTCILLLFTQILTPLWVYSTTQECCKGLPSVDIVQYSASPVAHLYDGNNMKHVAFYVEFVTIKQRFKSKTD